MVIDPEGYAEAVEAVMKMDAKDLLAYIDSLYGREDLPRSCMLEDIRSEALAQTERHYGPDYEKVMSSRKADFAARLVPQRGEG